MSKMEIFEPAMCCSTGLCGPSIDPELLRVSTVISNLKKKGVEVARYNLSSEPQAFMDSQTISRLISEKGPESLPATVVDGKVVKTQAYPTNEEFAKWLNISIGSISGEKPNASARGCGPGCCC